MKLNLKIISLLLILFFITISFASASEIDNMEAYGIGDIEITVPGLPLLKDFCGKHAVFLKACSRLSGALLLACTVLIVILLLSFDVYGMLTTARTYQYALGGDMINYAAGFVRRGLFGEIVYFLNQVFQPFVSVLIMSFVSILFMLYVLIARMVRLNMRLPYSNFPVPK